MKVNLGGYPVKTRQRNISVKIDRYDTWNLDHTLALIILPALLQYKECCHGIPNDFADNSGNDDVNGQMSFDFYQETHREAFDQSVERWNETLDKMIWSFYQIIVDDDSRYHHGEAVYTHKKVTGDLSEVVDTNPEDHWYDHKGHELHEQRIQEGLELFGKYFRNLWD